MSGGKRYDNEPKLNSKKIIGVIVAVVVIIICIASIKMLLNGERKTIQSTGIGYFSAYKDGKWGVINEKGETALNFEYDEMVIVPDPAKEIFIIVEEVNFENLTYKAKAINSKKQEIYSGYELVEAIDNFDSNGMIWYEKNVLKVKKDGKYGLINYSGSEILKCEYDSIYSLKGTKNSLILERDGKQGLASNVGDIIIKPEYISITALDEDYSLGYIVKNENSKIGIIDCNKKVVLDTIYDEVKQGVAGSIYVAKQDGKYNIINKEKEKLFELGSEHQDVLQATNQIIVAKKQNKVGAITITGEEIIPFEYQDLKYIFDKYYIAKNNDKYGVITNENTAVIDFSYNNIQNRKGTDFLEVEKNDIETDIYDKELNLKLTGIVSEVNTEKGYINIRIDNVQKYYNFKFEEKKALDVFPEKTLFLSKKDNKYGFINKDGKVVVDYIYDDAKEQNQYGYASIKKGNVWGSINKDGNISLAPSVNLDDYIFIDFIEKWHLAKDLNMNYYVQY